MEWKEWQCLPFNEKHNLPSIPGIYVVVDFTDHVWYVGKAINLNSRWNGRGHHRYAQLSRSNGKRDFKMYWKPCDPRELDQTERYYINLLKPSLNTTKVKKYSLGKPQLKIETAQGYVYFRGNPECYQEIAEYVGVFPCTPGDEQNVSIAKAQVVKRCATVIAIRYKVGGKSKSIRLLCSADKYDSAFHTLIDKPYRGGEIVNVWRPRRVYYH